MIIALLTDFGTDSPYVAQMKGVIYQRAPNATIVDVTHSISPQNVREAALVLRDVRPAFPNDTIFVVVVDPGVGSERRIICVPTNQGHFVGPDNGVFSLVVSDSVSVYNVAYDQGVSCTFHGRDVMAPAAALLCQGESPDQLGPRLDMAELSVLEFPRPTLGKHEVAGRIEYVDSFGNLISNIHRSDLDSGTWSVQFRSLDLPIVRCYSEAQSGLPTALFGSRDWLEIAVVNGSAERSLEPLANETLKCRRSS